ncbi:MAG: hypothetical protein ACREST_07600, partial [Steroidobacteraceae bacterium]
MEELRWILLGAGIALILGLWWWETRKARARIEASEALLPRERTEPSVDAPAAESDDAGTVRNYVPTIERVRAPRRPPLIEIPEDAEVD